MDGLTAHTAVALDPVSREIQFKETKSFLGQRMTDWRWFGWAGITVGVVGLSLAIMSTTAVIVMLPLKQTVVRFIQVDSSTGWVGDATSARDAPKMFNERVVRRDLRSYIENRAGYDPMQDHAQWLRVRAMSSPDVFSAYNDERKLDRSAVHELATAGHVEVDNFSWGEPIKQDDGTFVTVVQYQKQSIKGQTIGPWVSYHATIVYAYHPEMHQSEPDAEVNPDGFQVLRFHEDSP